MKDNSEKAAEYIGAMSVEVAATALVAAALVDMHVSPFGFWRTGALIWACTYLACQIRGKRVS